MDLFQVKRNNTPPHTHTHTPPHAHHPHTPPQKPKIKTSKKQTNIQTKTKQTNSTNKTKQKIIKTNKQKKKTNKQTNKKNKKTNKPKTKQTKTWLLLSRQFSKIRSLYKSWSSRRAWECCFVKCCVCFRTIILKVNYASEGKGKIRAKEIWGGVTFHQNEILLKIINFELLRYKI